MRAARAAARAPSEISTSFDRASFLLLRGRQSYDDVHLANIGRASANPWAAADPLAIMSVLPLGNVSPFPVQPRFRLSCEIPQFFPEILRRASWPLFGRLSVTGL